MQRHLKKIRYGVAASVFLLFAVLFLDLHGNLPQTWVKGTLFFQFVPSFLTFLQAAGWVSMGFIIVLGISLLVGRLYCSFLCPLGIFMDLVAKPGRQKKRNSRKYTKPHNGWRYGILLLTVVSLFGGILIPLTLLDPYSIFGRMMALIVRPLVAMGNNGVARLLEMGGIYGVSPYVQPGLTVSVLIWVSLYTLLICVLAVKKGRVYCNTLCPVGTLLGLFARGAAFKLTIDRNTCTRCGKCEKHCKASCIDSKQGVIDFSRCVTCYNCLPVCPENSIAYSGVMPKRGQEKTPKDPHRRVFMVAVTVAVAGVSKLAYAAKKPVVYVKNKIAVKRTYPITPPGSGSIAHFTNKCTACYLCVTACPGKVIQPLFQGVGGKAVLLPAMVNQYGYCNYDCTKCGEVCPTGAILPVTQPEKKQIQIGKVAFIRENCIVITQKTDCGACSEHCPTKAVFMVVENKLRVPSIKPDICVGCGACEYACPSIPHKSIYVDGNPVHLTAEKPVVKKLKQPDPDRDFPF